MVNLLSYLGDLSIHRLLMGCHDIKLTVQLVDGRTQSFIDLSLRCYELLHHTLQVGCSWLRWKWRWWGVGCSRLECR